MDRRLIVKSACEKVGHDRSRLLDILHDLHASLGYVGQATVDDIAAELGMPRVDVEAPLSFYGFFSREPRGRFVIRVCRDIVDRFLGADAVAAAFADELGIAMGGTSPDGQFTLVETPFIGMADQAPSALVNNEVVTDLSTDSARAIVRALRGVGDVRALAHTFGDGNNAHPLVRSMVRNNLRKTGPVIFHPLERGEALRRALGISPQEVIRMIKVARLRGRGGAGFPVGMKWEFARAATGSPKVMVCNADEGEMGTFKDRVILTEQPDLVFEGMTIAAYAVGANEGILYLRAEYAYLRAFLESVLESRRQAGLLGHDIGGAAGFSFDVRIQLGAGAYICGEETALINSCEGVRGDPRNRPPFPVERGYLGRPTVVNNVETLCCAARILEHGGAWFGSLGTTDSTGTKALSISGDCRLPGVYELPFGIRLRELLQMVDADDPGIVHVGGSSGRLVSMAELDRAISFEDLSTGGSIMVWNRQRDPLEIVLAAVDFSCEESCGFCVPCRVGNPLLRERITHIIAGRGRKTDLAYLESLCATVKATSRCGLGQSSPNPVESSLRSFRREYERRLLADESGLATSFDVRQALLSHEGVAGRTSVHFDQQEKTS